MRYIFWWFKVHCFWEKKLFCRYQILIRACKYGYGVHLCKMRCTLWKLNFDFVQFWKIIIQSLSYTKSHRHWDAIIMHVKKLVENACFPHCVLLRSTMTCYTNSTKSRLFSRPSWRKKWILVEKEEDDYAGKFLFGMTRTS